MLEDVQIEFIVAGGIVVLALIIAVILALVKPGKRLEVSAEWENSSDDQDHLNISIKSIGRKKVKLVPPYVRFRKGTRSRLFQIYLKDREKSYPFFIYPDEEISDKINLVPYLQMAEKKLSDPDTVQVIIKDTIGIDFKSEKRKLRK